MQAKKMSKQIFFLLSLNFQSISLDLSIFFRGQKNVKKKSILKNDAHSSTQCGISISSARMLKERRQEHERI